MNNEPVAWWARDRNTGIGYVQTSKPTRMDKVANEYIPLYASRQELSIEEIEEVSKEIFKDYKNFYHYHINFARAILRKAQEK
jgi:hypothetical protein